MSVKDEDVLGGYTEKDNDMASPAKKAFITTSEVKELSRDDIASRISQMDKYISSLEDKCESLDRLANTDVDEKLKLQQQESTRRENVLVMRLATKEQEMQELLTQIHELKQSQNPSTNQLKSTLLDPSVNLLFEKMKCELGDTKEKLEQAQNDLNAWKFTPDSVTGKKLMAKCRMLIAENQELGKQLSQGRIAQLEAELALQKKYNEELKSSQDELNEFVLQLDEEVEGMQSTICALQNQLKDTKQKCHNSQEEVHELKRRLEVQSTTKTDERNQADEARAVRINSKSHFEASEDQDEGIQKEFDESFKGTIVDTDAEMKTLTYSHEVTKTNQKSPSKASTTKNPFSISNLLSPDFDKIKQEVPWTDTDEVLKNRQTCDKDYVKDFGTNGQYVDSDDDMSS